MLNIKLLCVSGMLSIVILEKVKDAAKLKEIDIDIKAVQEEELFTQISKEDVVLLGPQIGYKLEKIKERCDSMGIASGVIGMKEYGLMDGDAILEFAINLKEKIRSGAIERMEDRKEGDREIQIDSESTIKQIECEGTREDFNEGRKEIIEELEKQSMEEVATSTDKSSNETVNVDSKLKGEGDLINKAKELILNAKKEIYLSTNINLEKFKNEFMEASQRGVRITVVSLNECNIEELQIDKLYTYIDEKVKSTEDKLMMVVDGNKAMAVDKSISSENILDVITDNILIVSIINTNIENYIYLLKLRENIAFKLKDN